MPYIRRSHLRALRTEISLLREQIADTTADAARDTAGMAHAHARTARTADEYREERDRARGTAVALEQDSDRLKRRLAHITRACARYRAELAARVVAG